ncbi:hypothetical protein C8F04DRAFT_1247073 [Mycena alexandri]|uniref:RING-type domain-containing protein n=1 Tax=Mycena alexandri TaxID=1745969 RepID=A0AAD6TIU6_9AGAR|nr:hypothetical protein C8F04DRAFT_1247073 [Mycena alexandri]
MENVEDRITAFIRTLPFLSLTKDVDAEDSCPICLTSFEALLQDADSEPAQCNPRRASEDASECGVTKLSCGHIFCRKDLLEWIRNLHGSCPTCRDEFLDIHPPGSDDESSDGGEYIPEDDEDEDDVFNTSDGFTDTDFDMDVDLEEDMWERSSDGERMQVNGAESEPSSEGDNSIEEDGVEVEVNVSVMEHDDQESFDDSSDDATGEEPKQPQ